MLGVVFSTFAAPDKPDSSAKIHALLEARRDVLKQRSEAVETQMKHGLLNDFGSLIAARNDLLGAELALASTKDERIALLKKHVANCLEYEKFNQGRFEAGRGATQVDVLSSTAARLEAEIALAREEAA